MRVDDFHCELVYSFVALYGTGILITVSNHARLLKTYLLFFLWTEKESRIGIFVLPKLCGAGGIFYT